MEMQESIQKLADQLLKLMIENYTLTVEKIDEAYMVSVKTEVDAPALIGRHGETIRAMQKILEVACFKELKTPVTLMVNVNDYREKQKERLEHIAGQFAERAKEQGRAVYARGFSSYERKMMHEFVANTFPELTSYSVGEGRERQLVIDMKKNEEVVAPSETATEE